MIIVDHTLRRLTSSIVLRSGSSTSCPVVGVAQAGDLVEYACFTRGPVGTWTYLHDLRTGVAGWARDDLLADNGSTVFCGF